MRKSEGNKNDADRDFNFSPNFPSGFVFEGVTIAFEEGNKNDPILDFDFPFDFPFVFSSKGEKIAFLGDKFDNFE